MFIAVTSKVTLLSGNNYMKFNFTQYFSTDAGFTLVEILVAIGIFALMSGVLSSVFFATLRTNTKTQIQKEVKQNGDFVLDIMTRMIQNSRKVSSACGSLVSSNPSIDIVNPDGGTTTFECRDDGGILRIASTSAGVSAYLSSPSVTLAGTDCTTALAFTCVVAPDGSQSIKIDFTLTQKGSSPKTYEQASNKFGTTVTLRN